MRPPFCCSPMFPPTISQTVGITVCHRPLWSMTILPSSIDVTCIGWTCNDRQLYHLSAASVLCLEGPGMAPIVRHLYEVIRSLQVKPVGLVAELALLPVDQ
ncbi:hypothetical protein VNO78_04755 [Psophocarpus tetragonolobus]|uniref:Uncharacterized protein n=1 Tax=Psophocarpus tetragonolobus TaxID=3891 RepID=A0AAN9XXV9_PSOTE